VAQKVNQVRQGQILFLTQLLQQAAVVVVGLTLLVSRADQAAVVQLEQQRAQVVVAQQVKVIKAGQVIYLPTTTTEIHAVVVVVQATMGSLEQVCKAVMAVLVLLQQLLAHQ
jgi:hypothetical protein